MNEDQLTEWFDGSKFVPGHVGVYEVDDVSEPYKSWNGIFWGISAYSVHEAIVFSAFKSMYQNPNWRGLRSEPK